jgi:hypothetical protein
LHGSRRRDLFTKGSHRVFLLDKNEEYVILRSQLNNNSHNDNTETINPNPLPQTVIDEAIGKNDEEVVSTNEEDAIVNDDANMKHQLWKQC